MKDFRFSAHTQKVISEGNLNIDWIEETFNTPDKIETDRGSDILEHRLKVTKENDYRVLRVICKKNELPVLIVTAFFDRRMKGKLL